MIGLGMYQRPEQRIYHTHALKAGLQQLFTLEQALRDPKVPEYMAKGLAGLEAGNRMLQERNASGVLIGGLAEAVWNRKRKPEELARHKDTDILVIDDDFTLQEDFEGGIDWWLPQYGRLQVITDASAYEADRHWWQNGNGVALSFGVQQSNALHPGLYIPNREWVMRMREYETLAHIDERLEVEINDDAWEAFRNRLEGRIRTTLPKYIRKMFPGRVFGEVYYETVGLIRFDRDIVVAINRFLGKEK